MALEQLRRALIESALAMNRLGLAPGKSGNASVRVDGGFLITPSGLDYEEIREDDIVFVALDGRAEGRRKPSSEWRMHRDLYARREDAGAVVHTHSPFATSLACLRRAIPAFHYMVAVAGGADIRCADYATFGTQELSDNALGALDGRRACLIANHGALALGRDLKDALALALEVETLARQYVQALQVGPPALLSEGEMTRVLERFKDYGKP